MDVILGLAATALGVFVFIQLITLIVISARLVKLQFWEPKMTPVARAEAESTLTVLDAARPALEQEGFRYIYTRRVRSFVISPSVLPFHSDIYYNAEHDVHAEVVPASMPTPRRPFDVYLTNTYTDGGVLLTFNGLAHLLTPYPRSFTVADVYAPNFSLQLAAHLERRAGFAGQRTDPAEAPALGAALARTLLPELEREGSMYRHGERDGEPVFGLRLLGPFG